jgi:hypothetical protein
MFNLEKFMRLLKELFQSIYRFIFARSYFEKFNKFLLHLSLNGLGFLNYKKF